MILWRVTNRPTLDGGGGLHAGGRWHTRGRRIVYCAPNPATALIEVLVHAEIDAEDVPVTFRFVEIDAPDSITIETVEPRALAGGWQDDVATTRRVGDDWLHSSRSALLRVPSVIVPETCNVLINPSHPDAALIRVVRIHSRHLDPRLAPRASLPTSRKP